MGVKKQRTSLEASSHNQEKGGDRPDPECGLDTSELYKDLSKGLRLDCPKSYRAGGWNGPKGVIALFF